MRLTLMTDYALRLLMHVAQHPGRLCTIAEVAQANGVSEAHLMKVTHRLGMRGWIETVRGKGGGMRLARAPREINLGEVIRSVEPDFDLVDCFAPGGLCVLAGRCRLSGVLGGAMRDFMAHLERHTLADVLPDARATGPMALVSPPPRPARPTRSALPLRKERTP